MTRNTSYNTRLDPKTPSEIANEPKTQYKRDLLLISKRLRTTEAQLEKYLSELNIAHREDLLNITISKQRFMIQSMQKMPTVRRARNAQNNLRRIYDQWEDICRRHEQAIED